MREKEPNVYAVAWWSTPQYQDGELVEWDVKEQIAEINTQTLKRLVP